ncbi:MAG: hypothetical protein IKU10_06190 [Clostridia bacterium]|nr:hypothetical protein [Clostridia bacterium]
MLCSAPSTQSHTPWGRWQAVELDAEGLFSDPNKAQTKQGSWDAETVFSRTIGVRVYVEFGKKR